VESVDTAYVFDNDDVHAVDQHRVLADMLDPLTTSRLGRTGITEGWRCLEIGAGGGSVAEWMAERTGPAGDVLATDIGPVHLRPRPNLRVMRHDIVRDPLPDNAFDLIHARLVLIRIPERLAVLDRLLRALKPGGWLQLDEFDLTYGPSLLMPDRDACELYESFLVAKSRLMEKAGVDVAWGQHIAEAMRRAGYAGIDPVPHLQMWHAGAPGTRLLMHHTFQLRDRFEAAGFTEGELIRVRALLTDPGFSAVSCPIYTVQGRRPS
jgi:SAM-dependent methyltransferase